MSALQILGALLIAAPFVAFGVMVVREEGWRELGLLVTFAGGIVAILGLGAYLLTGGAA